MPLLIRQAVFNGHNFDELTRGDLSGHEAPEDRQHQALEIWNTHRSPVRQLGSNVLPDGKQPRANPGSLEVQPER